MPRETIRTAELAIGVDLGGTKIATAVVDNQGGVRAEEVIPTRAEEGTEAVLRRIKESVRRVCTAAGIRPEETRGLGLGSPGPLDLARGLVIFTPNLGWRGVPLRAEMEDAFRIPVVLENDARAAAWGEYRYGAGQGTRSMIYVTLGTGIGGGLVLEGRLYHGGHGNAGEVGHTTVLPHGPRCRCGNRGCWEALASGTAIARRAQERIQEGESSMLATDPGLAGITAVEVARAAREGDRLAREVLEEAFSYIGLGVANLVNIFDPERVVLGGGLTAIGDPLFAAVRRTIAERVLPGPGREVAVVPAALGKRAGVIGAALLLFEENTCP